MRTAMAGAAGPGPEELGEWLAAGFSIAQARGWISDGVEPAEAKRWPAVGIPEAGDALRWRVRGFSPGEARLFGGVRFVESARFRATRRR